VDKWARVLAGEHLRVLRAFDEAFCGAFGASEPFRVAITAVGTTGERLAADAGVSVPPTDATAG
jgi:hypothetical protein